MPEDVDEHVAFEFHGLVSDLQRNDVERFEEEQKKQALQRAMMRIASRPAGPHQGGLPNQGLNASELLKALDGDPEAANRRVQEDLDRIDREAKVSADKLKTQREPLPEGNFPPPPGSE